MKLFLKLDTNALAKKILDEKLKDFHVRFEVINASEVLFLENISTDKYDKIIGVLEEYGFEIIENQKNILVQKIKDAIVEMVFSDDAPNVKSSVYLSEKLDHSYGYLSNLFSEVTYTSIENFIILQKIELTKQLIVNENLSLTEIAFKLNYSSVAHLSTQFKNTTGITPSAFQRIISKRREIATKNIN
ncbi:AraC family transcriptional regulator [Flavobacterium sp. 9AF]|uniref:helix-turn-helix domain-containing protein n=1 Tax=Flavobacterium sp. 9AF TaxID=2653142 RepID=UPI0012F37D85|nr:AraC family transcriptional regulator [Flavobacterium sp. 9AF]VXC41178.1 AraC family transcriptional regulator [Flavobacterium sp. 9AF]